jgi:apolipoprotein N-acyltransferase
VLEGTNIRAAAGISFAVGFLLSLAALSWISVITTGGLLITALYVASFHAFRGLGVVGLRRLLRLPYALAAPLAFVSAELFQSFFLTGFPWLYAGHALYRQKVLIQIADLTGSYGVTAVALALNGALVDLALYRFGGMKNRKALIAAGAAALLLGATLLYGLARGRTGEETGPEILMIQGNIPQEVKDSGKPNLLKDIWDTHIRLTLEGSRMPADLLVWPETMVPRSLTSDAEKLNGVLEIASDLDMDFLVGTVRIDPLPDGSLGDYNSAILVGKDGSLGRPYSKIHRVPGGEYIPFRQMFPALEPILMSMFGYLPDVAKGRSLECMEMVDRNGKQWKFGNLICYEAIFPELARPQVRDGAQFIVNVTNEGWFGDRGEQEQIQAAACFRAVENRVTVVRAANTGITAMIGPNGEIYEILEVDGVAENVEGTLVGRVRLDGRKTLYTYVGDLFAWLVALSTTVLLAAGAWIRHRKSP